MYKRNVRFRKVNVQELQTNDKSEIKIKASFSAVSFYKRRKVKSWVEKASKVSRCLEQIHTFYTTTPKIKVKSFMNTGNTVARMSNPQAWRLQEQAVNMLRRGVRFKTAL